MGVGMNRRTEGLCMVLCLVRDRTSIVSYRIRRLLGDPQMDGDPLKRSISNQV